MDTDACTCVARPGSFRSQALIKPASPWLLRRLILLELTSRLLPGRRAVPLLLAFLIAPLYVSGAELVIRFVDTANEAVQASKAGCWPEPTRWASS